MVLVRSYFNAILAAVERLAEIALEEGRTDLVEFAEKLKVHATTEEQVLYPAAMLVGKYLKHITRASRLDEVIKSTSVPQDPEC